MNLQETVAKWRKRLLPKPTSPITHLVPNRTGQTLCEQPCAEEIDFQVIDITPWNDGIADCYSLSKPTKPICPDCQAVLTELLNAPARPAIAHVCRKNPPCADGPAIPCMECINHEEGVG